MKKIIIILMSILTFPGVRGEMTLDDCLRYARDHAHSNRIQALETEKASVDRRIAASALMPYVGFSADGNVSFGRNIDPETNTYDNKKTLSTGFGLQMSLPLFDGLVSVNTLKAAGVARLRQEKTAQIEQDRVSLEVVRAFYNVSYCKAMVAQMESQLERDSALLVATERGECLGVKSGSDVAEMQALVASDEYELVNQRNLLSKAFLNLRSHMGMPLTDAPLDLAESEGETVASTVSGDVSLNPRVAEAQLALRESRMNLRCAKGAFSPKISLQAGVSTSFYRMMGSHIESPDFGRQWRDNMGQYVGVSFSFPIFTGLSACNRLRRSRIELEQSKVRLDQTIYEVEKETMEADLDLAASEEEYLAALRRVESEELAYRAVSRKYELGAVSVTDLYTSGVKLATARASLEGKRIQRIINGIVSAYYHGEKLIKE